MYSKEAQLNHGLNAAIPKKIRGQPTENLSENCKHLYLRAIYHVLGTFSLHTDIVCTHLNYPLPICSLHTFRVSTYLPYLQGIYLPTLSVVYLPTLPSGYLPTLPICSLDTYPTFGVPHLQSILSHIILHHFKSTLSHIILSHLKSTLSFISIPHLKATDCGRGPFWLEHRLRLLWASH